MAKNKKKKKISKGDGAQSAGTKVAKRLREISANPLVADIVAATLVAAASALKDSKKAQQLAASAGDELQKLAHEGAERGSVLWKLALDVGRKSVEALAGEDSPKRPKSKVQKKKTVTAKRPKAKARAARNPEK